MTNPNGTVPEAWEAQVRQCLENVKGIVEAAGLGMANVVATQVYVDDLRKWPEAAKIYAWYFPAGPPAMTLLEVAGMPGATRVEINAIAVRDLSWRRALQVAGVAAAADGALFCAAAMSPASLTPPQWMELDSFRERLRVNGFAPEQVVRFPAMNAIYAAVFGTQAPARTTVQPVKAAGTSPFRLSVVAEN